MNKYLVRTFSSYMPAVGVSGSDGNLFTGRRIACGDGEVTCTGKVETVNPGLLHLLLANGYVPVVSSTSMDPEGEPLNINADEAALAIAAALPSTHLLFLSDVPGILKKGEVIPLLTGEDTEREIGAGIIAGGMIPKVRSSIKALEEGVEDIIIGQYTDAGDLAALLTGNSGTRIVL